MKKILVLLMIVMFQMMNAQGNFFSGEQSNKSMGDLFNTNCCLMGKRVINGDVGLAYSKITYANVEGAYTDFDRFATNVNLTVKLYKDLQIRTSFYFDLNDDKNKPHWLSNVFYAIGYYNWRNNTFSYGYENYQPNKFDGSFNFFDNMKRGFFFTSFNHYLIKDNGALKLDESSQIYVSPFVRYSPEYTDRTGTTVLGNNKIVLGTSMRYVIWKNIYVEGAVYYYPQKDTKLPWDPDYTYGFGLFNWRSFKLNLSYGNWIANRFSAKDKEMKNDFMNGEFKAVFTFAW
jgi:hypothetical protein